MKKVIGILIAMILVFAIGGAGYFYIAPLFANSEEEADENKIYVQNVDEIVNGFLAEIPDQIIKIDKHAKRASVKITLAGSEKVIKVSFKTEQIPERTED